MKFVFSLFFSYFLGAIPFGWIFSKLVKGVDIRKMGSGRTGTTNTMRASGYPIALLTLFLDGFKGVASVWFARYIAPGMVGLEIMAPIFAIVGIIIRFFLWKKTLLANWFSKGELVEQQLLGACSLSCHLPSQLSALLPLSCFLLSGMHRSLPSVLE